MNFTYFYKKSFLDLTELTSLNGYDIYISTYENCDRILKPASKVKSLNYLWILTNKEDFNKIQNKESTQYCFIESSEDYEKIMTLFDSTDFSDKKICIDATGFFVPYLMFTMRYFYEKGIRKFDVIYTEPVKYIHEEDTQFSDDFYEVKQIWGMSGTHTSNMDNDLLIISAGYDHSRIIDVAYKKKEAKKILLFGFPSISAGMFQENVLRAYNAEPALGPECFCDMGMNIFAPAYDPFVTAQTIKEYIDLHDFSNLYLAPLSTKPQALGMALYYIWEKAWTKDISIIYPMCKNYHTKTSEGIARVWLYNVELPSKE